MCKSWPSPREGSGMPHMMDLSHLDQVVRVVVSIVTITLFSITFSNSTGVLVCKVSLEVACRALASCSWLNVASCGVGELLSLKKAPIGVATLIPGAMMMTMMMTMVMTIMMRVMMTVLTRVMCPPPRRGRVLRAWRACDRGEVGVSSNGSAPQNLTRPRFQVSRPDCEST